MKTLGSAPESRDPETRAALEKDASSFLDDLARWTSELKASGADLEPAPVRPRSGPGVAPIRNVPAATVVARGPRDKKASDEKASSSAGAPNPPPPPPSDAAFAEATSRALGLDDGGAAASALRDFADSASKKDADVVDLSVPGASNAEKTLAAMAGASASERKWVARREREKGNELFRAREYSSAVDAYALALALDPACVAARSNRAAANMKLRRWRDAIADCDAVIAAEPEHVKALARRGESRLELHPGEGDANARAALADLEKAAAIEPGNEHVRALERRARKAVAETAPTRRVAIETEEEAKEEDGAALEKKTEEPKKPKAAERFEAAREGPMVIEEVEDEPAKDEPAEPRQVSESRRRVVIEEEESEESEDEADASDERKSAEKKESTPAWALEKEKGNAAFGRGDFHAARERYDAALALVPASDASASATLLANRAAARQTRRYAAAESDASAALAGTEVRQGAPPPRVRATGNSANSKALEDYERWSARTRRTSASRRRWRRACAAPRRRCSAGSAAGSAAATPGRAAAAASPSRFRRTATTTRTRRRTPPRLVGPPKTRRRPTRPRGPRADASPSSRRIPNPRTSAWTPRTFRDETPTRPPRAPASPPPISPRTPPRRRNRIPRRRNRRIPRRPSRRCPPSSGTRLELEARKREVRAPNAGARERARRRVRGGAPRRRRGGGGGGARRGVRGESASRSRGTFGGTFGCVFGPRVGIGGAAPLRAPKRRRVL